MPPAPGKRMTANPVRPARYRPGKAIGDDRSDSEDEADAADDDEQEATTVAAPRKSASTSNEAGRITSNLQNVDLNERRRQAEAQERVRQARERAERERLEAEAGFVTESEGDSEEDSDTARQPTATTTAPIRPAPLRNAAPAQPSSDSDGSDSDSDSSASSSSSDTPRLQRPVFIRKAQRGAVPLTSTDDDAVREAEAARRQATTDALVQEKLERDAAARAAGKKDWDDDEPGADELVSDTDDADPALERAQWEARELSRLKRGRAALEAREADLAEVERRRALTTPEREAEDALHVDAQRAERAGRGKMNALQRYHHKGAFYQDEAREQGLLDRDLMSARYADQRAATDALPEYLRVRDVTKIGRKGRTRYKDLKSEDTGRWGEFGGGARRGGGLAGDVDERFRPDDGRGMGPTGANAGVVGQRKRGYGDGEARGDGGKRARYEDAART